MITYTIRFVTGNKRECRTDRYSIRLEEMGVWVTELADGDNWIVYPWSQIAYVSSDTHEVNDDES